MKYKVICKQCKASDQITIANSKIDWRFSTCNNIISGRLRLDNQFGWQCVGCNNNDLLTKQEEKQITDLVNPDPMEIAAIVRNLKPDKTKFEMQMLTKQ